MRIRLAGFFFRDVAGLDWTESAEGGGDVSDWPEIEQASE